MQKIKVVTHNGRFHADDVCAIAILDLVFDGNIDVVRTRDEAIIAAGDIVLDVGGKNDGEKNFDHHQPEGGGVRNNGIPYASFGLIWKRFGSRLTKRVAGDSISESEVVNIVNKFDIVFVQPIDALDNGVVFYESKIDKVRPFSFDTFVYSSNPTWKEDESKRNDMFFETVDIMKKIIVRELTLLLHEAEAKAIILKNYKEAEDKRIIVLDSNFPYHETLGALPEPIYAIYKSPQLESWHIGSVPKKDVVFEIRKQLPKAWAGLMNEELQKASGISDALFCHRKLFMCTAKTKEGAVAMAKRALVE